MSVVFAIPVHAKDVERCSETFAKWRNMGYHTAALGDRSISDMENCDLRFIHKEYKGWAWAVNELSHELGKFDWLVTGGADVFPDPNLGAAAIAEQCAKRFHGTMGIMQPCGDRYGALVDQSACVSPWLGKRWCEKAYAEGPLCEVYPHYYGDTELASVAALVGALWWREDLNQYHDHYLRRGEPTPEHLKKWQPTVAISKHLFESRRDMGFPGFLGFGKHR